MAGWWWASTPAPGCSSPKRCRKILSELASGDFNGDGLDDLVGFSGGEQLVYLQADSFGHFSTGKTSHLGPTADGTGTVVADWPASSRVAMATAAGLTVLDAAAGHGISQEAHLLSTNQIFRLDLDPNGVWFQSSDFTGLGQPTLLRFGPTGATTMPVAAPAGAELLAALDQRGSAQDSVIILSDPEHNGYLESASLDGGTTLSPLPGISGAPVMALQSSSGVLNDLVTQPSSSGPILYFAGATDGSLSWPATATTTFQGPELSPELGITSVTLEGARFSLRANGPADQVLVAALTSSGFDTHYFTFQPSTGVAHEIGVNLDYGQMVIADFDGDGLSDVLCTVVVGSNFETHLFRQRDDGTFDDTSVNLPIPNPAHLLPIDVDGDGKVDVVLANFQSGTMAVHLNRTPPGGPAQFE